MLYQQSMVNCVSNVLNYKPDLIMLMHVVQLKIGKQMAKMLNNICSKFHKWITKN